MDISPVNNNKGIITAVNSISKDPLTAGINDNISLIGKSSERTDNIKTRITLSKNPSPSNAHTAKRALQLLDMKKNGLEKLRDLPTHSDSVSEEWKCVPETVEPMDPKGFVFRHYFGNNSMKENALKDNTLIAGWTPYVIKEERFKQVFSDLRGVFLTNSTADPVSVGVFGDLPYIDFTVPEDTAVLKIEKDIYLVPGDFKTPDWAIKMYEEKYRKGLPVPEIDIPYMDYLSRTGICSESTKVYFTPEENNLL